IPSPTPSATRGTCEARIVTVAVRFAPSPTGLLQAGNGRAAVLNALFALQHGGRFLLRIDDTDETRSRAEFETAIVDDMAGLGIPYDPFERQSARIGDYGVAAEGLKESGRLYACFETAAELERKRRRQMSAGKPPV